MTTRPFTVHRKGAELVGRRSLPFTLWLSRTVEKLPAEKNVPELPVAKTKSMKLRAKPAWLNLGKPLLGRERFTEEGEF